MDGGVAGGKGGDVPPVGAGSPVDMMGLRHIVVVTVVVVVVVIAADVAVMATRCAVATGPSATLGDGSGGLGALMGGV